MRKGIAKQNRFLKRYPRKAAREPAARAGFLRKRTVLHPKILVSEMVQRPNQYFQTLDALDVAHVLAVAISPWNAIWRQSDRVFIESQFPLTILPDQNNAPTETKDFPFYYEVAQLIVRREFANDARTVFATQQRIFRPWDALWYRNGSAFSQYPSFGSLADPPRRVFLLQCDLPNYDHDEPSYTFTLTTDVGLVFRRDQALVAFVHSFASYGDSTIRIIVDGDELTGWLTEHQVHQREIVPNLRDLALPGSQNTTPED